MIKARGIRPAPARGFALPAAIFGLVIVGVLVTGGFYIARQETRIGIANRQATRAFYIAERGVSNVMESFNAGTWINVADWTTQTVVDSSNADGVATVDITRMSQWAYYLEGTGDVTQGGALLSGASRQVGMIARLMTAQIETPAALTTQGNVSVRGGALVTGYDINPEGWDFCPTADDDKLGILLNEGGSVGTTGGGEVLGVPSSWDTDPGVTEASFTQFGDLSWADLVAMATLTLPGGNFNGMAPSLDANGNCNLSDQNNWGDPENPYAPCGNYFPIIYVAGLARVQSTSVGQGILLVEGDLDLRGSFTFHGIIITQGTFMTQGSGHRIKGAVLAKNADLDLERLVGGSIVQYSSCAITQSLLNNPNLTRLVPITERSWVDLSNLAN